MTISAPSSLCVGKCAEARGGAPQCPSCGAPLKIRRWHQESLFPGERGGKPMALVYCRWPECTYSEVVVEEQS